ncbi:MULTISPECIES: methylisocitrate lyase [Stappiaceae]|jgi:methylisocitrate lyase|uniref:2-methylisocitrate lyase n=2 Tax=Roseibium TaxID=150830 RepID=A0A0M6YBB0_9HYPH|nr:MULTISPECIES: methylisocitrate lyase [Stappiaceae]MCR9283977.1 methylisocitrate lyase [Paracoccaceae bacterium]MEC9405181.1 methylisocitrate lyase [Pseudomonadota bacterium]AMN51732.1 2-methylisocitrate lyase [Labrenzia sp. CP4]AQQ04810.1 methylisocitrate lyase [Roseibium aggregatum]ERP86126.1 2-methylisocitrate lyase [Labrenzia sp. C1B10]
MTTLSAGARFRQALKEENPLQVMGSINAYTAMMAERVGYKALYLAGAGVANASYGLPDLGITNLSDVLTDLRRVTDASSLPVLVDVDTGFGGAFTIARLVRGLIKDGAGAMHMEDQVQLKRCGHRPGKEIVSKQEMVDRVKAAVDAKTDDQFFIVARTDALAIEGLNGAIDRACAYVEAGADMIFAEACTELSQYKAFVDALDTPYPVLANITEFSKTPNFTLDELRSVGVSAALYPLSANRAMNAAALKVYKHIREVGSATGVLDIMQKREELYDFLNYHDYERKIDELFQSRK